MRAHMPLPVERAHFERWLEIFEMTARNICPPAAADVFIDRARRIADSLELGIATSRGEIATPRWTCAKVPSQP
jgi:hemoglobin